MTQATGTTPMPTPQRQRRIVLAPVVGMVLLAICGLVVIGLLSSSIGVVGVLVGAICALLPVGPVVATFLWIDRWEPEPPRLLLLAFVWGASFAALSALLVNSSAVLIANEVLGRDSGDLIGTVVVAPIVEEAVKGAFLVGLLIFRRREFDGVVDGIVYAGLVAAGFAFTENILYLGGAFARNSVDEVSGGVAAVLLLRGVLSPFAHPLFTAMTGIGAGIAAHSRVVGVRVAAVSVGYLVAVALHAVWNGSATRGAGVFYGVYGLIMVPLFLGMIAVVFWQRRREQRIVVDQLPSFAQAGWIAPSEIPLLSSMAGRQGWQKAVRRRSGRAVAKAVSEYQAAVTELAFLRAKMSRGAVGQSGYFWHEEALSELRRARSRAVSHPEALTVALRHHGPQGGWTPPPPGPPPGAPGRGVAPDRPTTADRPTPARRTPASSTRRTSSGGARHRAGRPAGRPTTGECRSPRFRHPAHPRR